MSTKRIIYRNWIVDLGYDPLAEIPAIFADPVFPNQRIIEAVRKALERLSEGERYVVTQFYFEGRSIRKIAELMVKPENRVAGIHRRGVAKLRKFLAEFVKIEFGIDLDSEYKCVLCESEKQKEIDKLIKSKRDDETWKRIIKTLLVKYNIKISSPQILIGHQKYHLK